MIIDCHTHVWESPDQLGRSTAAWGRRSGSVALPKATPADHFAACRPVDWTVVLAFKSRYLDAEVSNEFVSRYVRSHPDRLIGFACVDASRPRSAIDDLHEAHGELGLKGLGLWPAAQDFHPASTGAMRVYAEAVRLGMPVLFHAAIETAPPSKMEYAHPYLVDEVAREFPELKIVISHLGYPWTDETLVLLCKHEHVFADISGLLRRPWQAYNALLAAYQSKVMDRLLFGSDFPYASAAECIEALYSINQFCHGTNLPTIPREQLRRIVERDALNLLGIEVRSAASTRQPDTTVIKSDD